MTRQRTYAETDGMNFISRSCGTFNIFWVHFLEKMDPFIIMGSLLHSASEVSTPLIERRDSLNFDANYVLMVDDVFVKHLVRHFDWSRYLLHEVPLDRKLHDLVCPNISLFNHLY